MDVEKIFLNKMLSRIHSCSDSFQAATIRCEGHPNVFRIFVQLDTVQTSYQSRIFNVTIRIVYPVIFSCSQIIRAIK